jgi:uncharacterized phage-associated protein
MMSVKDVAKYFLSRSTPNTEEAITHLKLQKLVYYAQAWHLALRGTPLFKERIEAWVHGPVCPDLYYEYRDFGYQDIPPFTEGVTINDPNTEELLDAVWEAYGRFDGKYLEELTHQEDPWLLARENLNDWSYSNNEITHESMKKFYRQVLLLNEDN